MATIEEQMKSKGRALEPAKAPSASARPAVGPVGQLEDVDETTIVTAEDIASFRQGVEALCQKIEKYLGLIAKMLRDSENIAFHREKIRKFVSKIAEAIMTTSTEDDAQERVRAFAMAKATELFPATSASLRTIAALGLGADFFAEAGEEDERRGRTVRLFVDREDGRGWEQKSLTSNRPSARQILGSIRKMDAEARRARAAARKDELAELRKEATSKSYLSAIEAGEGLAILYVPPEERRGKTFYGGNALVEVSARGVRLVKAVGGFAGIVRQIAEAEIVIPTDQIEADWLKLPTRLGDNEFRLARIAQNILRRGHRLAVEEAKRNAATDALKSRATISAKDFDAGKPGVAYVYVRDWKEMEIAEGEGGKKVRRLVAKHDFVPFLAERNGEGKIRVVGCLPEHERLFASCREFADPQRAENSQKPYDGLGVLDAMLRTAHLNLERARNRNVSQANGVSAEADFARQMLEAAGEAPLPATPKKKGKK